MESCSGDKREIITAFSKLNYITRLSITIIFLSAAAVFLNGCDFFDYREAVSYLEKGEYGTAGGMFRKLGGYKDSREKFQESYYLLAISRMKEGKFSSAIECFNSVTMSYKDTSTLREKCYYEFLVQYFSADRDAKIFNSITTIDIVKHVREVDKNKELAPLLAKHIYTYAVKQLNADNHPLSIPNSVQYFELTEQYITPDHEVLDKLYQYGMPLLKHFLSDVSTLYDHVRLEKSIFQKNDNNNSNRHRFYYNLDRIFAYLSVTNYLDSADWNHRLEQSKILPFVKSSGKYMPHPGEAHALPQSCMVVANGYPTALMVDMKAALGGKIYFTDDANQSGFVVILQNEYKLAHAAVMYAGGVSVDYYDTKSTVHVKNSAGENLYSRSCISRYGEPQPLATPGERSKRAVPMAGDECARVTDDIVQIFNNFYGNK